MLIGEMCGPYRVLEKVGEGGMGEVYRATDTRLNRDVAIKAMHPSVGQDPERVARFEREAQLLASLNHPNIAAIHGLETVEGAAYLVLEFVEGRTLAAVIREDRLPVTEALGIARQVADALSVTHERGIIHRDLKPGNVMVTADGQVKVLDFGLGKAIEGGSGAEGVPESNSPTMTMAATQAGIILGTAGYMSPEQAKGRNADKRSDVWAFGCVLFEMLSGRRAFEGEDITEILAAIVRGEPDWAALPADTPPAIRSLVERCLVKNRANRLSDMSVVRYVLSEPTSALSGTMPPVRAVRGSVFGLRLAAALLGIGILVGAGGMRFNPWSAASSSRAETTALSVGLPDGHVVGEIRYRPLAISRDGMKVAYVGMDDGLARLFVRALGDSEPRALEGTAGASMPFFSHDGDWIGFFAQGQLKKISTSGAGLRTVTDQAPNARGGAWGPDDTIYFAPTQFSGLVSVPAGGGAITPVTTLDSGTGEVTHRWPFLLPDGRTLLFTSWVGPGPDERLAAVTTLGSPGHHVLLSGADSAQYVDGQLLYGKGDNLFAVPWRPGQTDLGRAVPVHQSVHPRMEADSMLFAAADRGTLVYVRGSADRTLHRAVWVDRSGRTSALAGLPLDDYQSLALSPDNTRAVVQIRHGVERLWIYDFSRSTLTPLTTADASSQAPIWTADGESVIYRGTRTGTRNLYRKRVDGTGTEERLTTTVGVIQTPQSVSSDGQWLLFFQSGEAEAGDVLALHLSGDFAVRPLVQTAALEHNGQVSPDGRWLAYLSDRSSRMELYIQPFPDPGPATQVSSGGAQEPRWSRDGRELFYVPLSADRLLAVTIAPGPRLVVGQPRLVYEGVYKGSSTGNTPYDITRDGTRFLRSQPTRPGGLVTQLEVLLNWRPAGK